MIFTFSVVAPLNKPILLYLEAPLLVSELFSPFDPLSEGVKSSSVGSFFTFLGFKLTVCSSVVVLCRFLLFSLFFGLLTILRAIFGEIFSSVFSSVSASEMFTHSKTKILKKLEIVILKKGKAMRL